MDADAEINRLVQTKLKLYDKILAAEELLEKSPWTDEDYRQYGSKQTVQYDNEIRATEIKQCTIEIQLCTIEIYLKKPFNTWTSDEIERYTNKEELKKERASKENEKQGINQRLLALIESRQKASAPAIQGESIKSKKARFIELLKEANISRPNDDIVNKVIDRALNQFERAVLKESPDECADLYQFVKSIPNDTTLMKFQNNNNFRIAYTDFDKTSNCALLKGYHCNKPVILKLLLTQSGSNQNLEMEIEAWEKVHEMKLLHGNLREIGIVDGAVVKDELIHIDRDSYADSSSRQYKWKVIMTRWCRDSLETPVHVDEDCLQIGFNRMMKTLNWLHETVGLVHMDVKLSNVVFDNLDEWFLIDLGSAVPINSPILSFTEFYLPFELNRGTVSAIPSFDYVMLCVMLACASCPGHRGQELCDFDSLSRHVSAELVLKKLESMKSDSFREDLVSVFTDHLKILLDHLSANGSLIPNPEIITSKLVANEDLPFL